MLAMHLGLGAKISDGNCAGNGRWVWFHTCLAQLGELVAANTFLLGVGRRRQPRSEQLAF